MKKSLMLVLVTMMSAGWLTGCQNPTEPVEPPIPSHVVLHTTLKSKYVTNRTLRVWLPAGYSKDKKYDVLYMHDGLNLFDPRITWNHQEWGVDEAMDSLVNQGIIRPTIVVGIDNIDNGMLRVAEYCPDDVGALLPSGKALYDGLGTPKGNDYLRFIVEEVKPFIDSIYATYTEREHTWMMGSSCGGLISSYALCKYPEVFGGAACLSTHSTLAADPSHPDQDAINAYRTYLQQHLTPNTFRLYFDRGDQTLDANYADSQEAINTMLRAEGWDSTHFMYRFFPGAAHDENSWKARLDIPLRFLLAD